MPDDIMQPSPKSKRSKRRLVLACAGTLCLGFVLVFVTSRRAPEYWAFSSIIMEPYTNAVCSRPFEAQTIKSIPSVRRLEATPSFTNAAAAKAWSTNKVISGAGAPSGARIRIMALGSSPQEAQSAANAAATQLCVIIHRQYGGEVSVLERAEITGRWLLLYELKLRVARLLNVNI